MASGEPFGESLGLAYGLLQGVAPLCVCGVCQLGLGVGDVAHQSRVCLVDVFEVGHGTVEVGLGSHQRLGVGGRVVGLLRRGDAVAQVVFAIEV